MLQRGLRVPHFSRGWGCRGPAQRVAVLDPLHHHRVAHARRYAKTGNAARGVLFITRGLPRDVHLLIRLIAPYPHVTNASKCTFACHHVRSHSWLRKRIPKVILHDHAPLTFVVQGRGSCSTRLPPHTWHPVKDTGCPFLEL